MGLGNVGRWTQQEFGAVLSELFDVHHRSLVRLAAIYLDHTAEDAVQDAFVQVWLRWDGVQDLDKVLAYLRRAVLNNAKSQLRHRRVVEAYALKLRPVPDAAATEDVALGRFGDEAVVRRLRRLPARQAACAALRFVLDLSEQETAEVLGISPGAVKQHTSRARKKLARMLESNRD